MCDSYTRFIFPIRYDTLIPNRINTIERKEEMKTRLSVFTVFLIVVVLSGCATPAVVTKVSTTETSLPVDEDVIFPTETVILEPTLTPTIEPTPTELPTPTVTPTPEPVLWCSDVIENCYFIGSEIARIFAVMTLPCFVSGGECYPPVEDCSKIPPSVVHVLVEDWAEAWEQEVSGNLEYILLDSNLYDPEIEYCFVDESIAYMIRDFGNEDYQANKSCLDNADMPCDIVLQIGKIDCSIEPLYCTVFLDGAYLTEKNFVVSAEWLNHIDVINTELPEILEGWLAEYQEYWVLFRVYTSTGVGFEVTNKNPPADIFLSMK